MANAVMKSPIFDKMVSEKSNVMFFTHRKATFKNWCFDKGSAPCSSDALARAGFIYSGDRRDPAVATCVFCFKEMVFEEEDDPWEEHRSHSRNCRFVELNKLDENEWTIGDFLSLLFAHIAAEERSSAIRVAEAFKAAAEENAQMLKKYMKSLK